MSRRKIKVNRDILIVSVLSLILVITWIFVEVFNALKQPIDYTELKKKAKPINSKLDKQVFANLSSRLQVDLSTLPEEIITPQTNIGVLSTPNQPATVGGSLTSSLLSKPAGTASGQLAQPTTSPTPTAVTPEP